MHIQDCLEEILHLEDTDLAASLADASRLFSCKKRQLVAKPDACSDWIPFLVSGVIRGYLTDEKGRDITDCFLYRPGEAVLSLSILTASFPINFEAVTDCVLLSIPTQLLAEQFQQSAELQQLYSSYLLEKLKLERELKLLLGISSAMERYQWFLRRYPELADSCASAARSLRSSRADSQKRAGSFDVRRQNMGGPACGRCSPALPGGTAGAS